MWNPLTERINFLEGSVYNRLSYIKCKYYKETY